MSAVRALPPPPAAGRAPVWLSSGQAPSQQVPGDSKDETSSPLPCMPACPMLGLPQTACRIWLEVTAAEITAIRRRIPYLTASAAEDVPSAIAFQAISSVYHPVSFLIRVPCKTKPPGPRCACTRPLKDYKPSFPSCHELPTYVFARIHVPVNREVGSSLQ